MQKPNEKGEKKIFCWLPGPFVDRFYAYMEKRKAGSVHRVTIREIVYEALNEYMARHPAK